MIYFEYALLAFALWTIGDSIFGSDGPEDDTTETDTDTETPPVDPEFLSGPTVVSVTNAEGDTTEQRFEDVDFDTPPTVTGSEDRDTIVASDETGFEMTLDAGGGDDTVEFGFGASVLPGEGSDIMLLNVTPNALASDSSHGTVDLSDSDDALSITFEDDTPEFVHTVRGTTTTTQGDETIITHWVDVYVSDAEDLPQDGIDRQGGYDPADATLVLRAELGQATVGNPDTVINGDPNLVFNRPVASAFVPG